MFDDNNGKKNDLDNDCMWEYDGESFLGDDMGENYFNDHLLKPTTRLTL